MKTTTSTPIETSLSRLAPWIIGAGFAATTLVAAIAAVASDNRERDRIQQSYCQARGFQTYTHWGRKCVGPDGIERVIPDRTWTDAGVDP